MKPIKAILIFVFIIFIYSFINAENLTQDVKSNLEDVSPITGYKYFSGYFENTNHNHPAIFVYGYKENANIVVTGRGSYQVFSINEWSKAIKAYKAILKANGYQPAN